MFYNNAMRERLATPVIVLGLAVGTAACSGSSREPQPLVPQEVADIHERVLQEYGCDVQPANLRIEDLTEVSEEVYGKGTVIKAITTEDGIFFNAGETQRRMGELVVHESVHWCADPEHSRSLSPPIKLPGVGTLTAVEGFRLFAEIRGDSEVYGTIDEGVVEWLARQTSEHATPNVAYDGPSDLTESIVKLRHSDSTTIVDLLKADDIVGLVGLMKNKPSEAVTGQDIGDIVNLYMHSVAAYPVPDKNSLQRILNN